ncbi:MAG TPA: hypothetical protein VN495_04425 [Candidatus Paceibacterota bacterium]|nr:hypothetical protein [Candidatus Paceibacterota bacterium]
MEWPEATEEVLDAKAIAPEKVPVEEVIARVLKAPSAERPAALREARERLLEHQTVIAHLERYVADAASRFTDEPSAAVRVENAVYAFLREYGETFTPKEKALFDEAKERYSERVKYMRSLLEGQVSATKLFLRLTGYAPVGRVVAIRDWAGFHFMCEDDVDFARGYSGDVSEMGINAAARAGGSSRGAYSFQRGITFDPQQLRTRFLGPNVYDIANPSALPVHSFTHELWVHETIHNANSIRGSKRYPEFPKGASDHEVVAALYAEEVYAWMDTCLRDEIIAYWSQHSAASYIKDTLTKPFSSGGLYDYFNESIVPEITREAPAEKRSLYHEIVRARVQRLVGHDLPEALEALAAVSRRRDYDEYSQSGGERSSSTDLLTPLLLHVPLRAWKRRADIDLRYLKQVELPDGTAGFKSELANYCEKQLQAVEERAKKGVPLSEQHRIRSWTFREFQIANRSQFERVAYLEVLTEYGLAHECELEAALDALYKAKN